jgi:hypothetical protein
MINTLCLHHLRDTEHLFHTGRPCCDKSKGLKINHQQSIASFFSKTFPNPIEAKLDRGARYDDSTPFSKVASASVSVGKGDNTDLLISFMRTVRIPEDRENYDLPPGLGNFPLFDIRPFSHRLPPSIAAQGGLFLPMYRKSCLRLGFRLFLYSLRVTEMEAMWINFDCIGD